MPNKVLKNDCLFARQTVDYDFFDKKEGATEVAPLGNKLGVENGLRINNTACCLIGIQRFRTGPIKSFDPGLALPQLLGVAVAAQEPQQIRDMQLTYISKSRPVGRPARRTPACIFRHRL